MPHQGHPAHRTAASRVSPGMAQTYGPPAQHQAPRRGRPNLVIIIAITAAITALAVAATIIYLATRGTATPTRSLSGQVTIVDTDPTSTKFTWDEKPATCSGYGTLADLDENASVQVQSLDGKVLAVGHLGAGIPAGIKRDPVTRYRVASRCDFQVMASEVPVRTNYKVVVGNQATVAVSGGELGHVAIRFGG